AFKPPSKDFGSVRGIVFSNDADYVISNSSGGQPWVWSMRTGKPERSLPTPGGPGLATTGNYVKPMILTGGEDGQVILWDQAKGTVEQRFEGCMKSVSCVALSLRS